MRTTVAISDELLREAKVKAAREDRSLSSLVEEALRLLLAEADATERAVRADFTWPTFDGGGAAMVDLDDNSAVLDAMDRA